MESPETGRHFGGWYGYGSRLWGLFTKYKIVNVISNLDITTFDGTLYIPLTSTGETVLYRNDYLFEDLNNSSNNQNGSLLNRSSHKLSAEAGKITIDKYDISITLVNLNNDQNINAGKDYNTRLTFTKLNECD